MSLVDTGDGLEVAYFDYAIPLSPAERNKYERFDLTKVSVKHNLWFKFQDERLSYIGIWREDDFP